MDGTQLPRGLGWFSIGLGIALCAAPRRVGTLIGSGSHTGVLRAVGVREIATGLGTGLARHTRHVLEQRLTLGRIRVARTALHVQARCSAKASASSSYERNRVA